MPLKDIEDTKCSKWILLRNFIFGLSFILVASVNDNPATDTKRNPSSIPAKVSTSLLGNTLIKHTKKLSVPMVTNISSDLNEVLEGDTVTLTGVLKTSSKMKNVEIKWIIPSEYSVINGAQISYITTTEPGQNYQFQITVKSNTSNNKIFHLVAKSQIGDSQYSNSSQFHTKIQNKLKDSNERLFQRSKRYLEANN